MQGSDLWSAGPQRALCADLFPVYNKHETGRCQGGFAHKVNMFGVLRKGRALTKENGKSQLRLLMSARQGGPFPMLVLTSTSACHDPRESLRAHV